MYLHIWMWTREHSSEIVLRSCRRPKLTREEVNASLNNEADDEFDELKEVKVVEIHRIEEDTHEIK